MKTEKIINIIGLTLAAIALILVVYTAYDYFNSGTWSMERTVKKSLDDSQEFANAKLITPDKGIAFVDYNCKPINRITKGIKRCKGRYYITINKVQDEWVVNESTRTTIW